MMMILPLKDRQVTIITIIPTAKTIITVIRKMTQIRKITVIPRTATAMITAVIPKTEIITEAPK